MRKQQRTINNNLRRWNEMNHDLLVNIMQRLTWKEMLFRVPLLCRSWLAALLDALFPPNNVLDLRPIDSLEKLDHRSRYFSYVMIVLRCRPISCWSKLYLPKTVLRDGIYRIIGDRTPSLRYLIVPDEVPVTLKYLNVPVFPCWRKLREVRIYATVAPRISHNCKYIRRLHLQGVIEDYIALSLGKGLPLLKRLVIRSCVLSMDALGLILDGHKNLELLDTRHCYRAYQRVVFYNIPVVRANDWNEEEINQKAAAVKEHLQCPRKHCPKCYKVYFGRPPM